MIVSKNDHSISIAKQQLTSVQNRFDAIYKAFAAIDISVTIPEILSLLEKEVNRPSSNPIPQGIRALMTNPPEEVNQTPDYLIDFVKNKIVNSMEAEPSIGGVKLTKEALKNMIELPVLDELTELLPSLRGLEITFIRDKFLFWLDIENGSIIEAPTAAAAIEEKFSVTVSTPKGIEKANQYAALCDALNTAIENKIGLGKLTSYGDMAHIPGILFDSGNGFSLDGSFIKSRFDK